MGFDQVSGKLWVADVGQATVEEIDVIQAGGNYAWPRCEGTQPAGCQLAGDVAPVFEYLHSGAAVVVGSSVTGGAVAGKGFGSYADQYFFGDYVAGKIWRAQLNASRDGFSGSPAEFLTSANGPVDIVFGPEGDMYYVAINSGQVRRVTPNYVRPKGASPIYLSMVPAYQACGSPNRTHASPLSYSSCTPPGQTSGSLTFGTPDVNGVASNSTGFAKVTACLPPSCANSDLNIDFQLTDVRCKAGVSPCTSANAAAGADYSGQLQLRLAHRITDKDNPPPAGGSGAGTTTDNPFNVTVPCANTADTGIGATCSIATSANAVNPTSVKSAMRTIWALNQLQVLDGGVRRRRRHHARTRCSPCRASSCPRAVSKFRVCGWRAPDKRGKGTGSPSLATIGPTEEQHPRRSAAARRARGVVRRPLRAARALYSRTGCLKPFRRLVPAGDHLKPSRAASCTSRVASVLAGNATSVMRLARLTGVPYQSPWALIAGPAATPARRGGEALGSLGVLHQLQHGVHQRGRIRCYEHGRRRRSS